VANFKHYFNNNFAGCRLIAHARDEHRNRDVRLYLIPGHLDAVGVTDGVDKWVAPSSVNVFSVDLAGTMRRISAGEHVDLPLNKPQAQPVAQVRTRRTLVASDGSSPSPAPRRTLIAAPAPVSARRRLILN
jgi:hypothetical protein